MVYYRPIATCLTVILLTALYFIVVFYHRWREKRSRDNIVSLSFSLFQVEKKKKKNLANHKIGDKTVGQTLLRNFVKKKKKTLCRYGIWRLKAKFIIQIVIIFFKGVSFSRSSPNLLQKKKKKWLQEYELKIV